MKTTPRTPRTRWIVALVLAAAAVGAGAWWWSGARRDAVIAAAVPARPDLTGWHEDLRRSIESAEQRALAGADSADALATLTRLYHANGFFGAARAGYAGLLTLEPDHPRWNYRLAYLHAGAGDTAEAETLLRHVIDLAPDYLPARVRLGELLLKDGRREAAEAAFAAAQTLRPGDPYVRLGLARCAMEAGDWPLARQHLEAVVQGTDYQLGTDLIVTVYEKLELTDQARAVRGRLKAWGAYQDMEDPWIEELLADSYDAYPLSLAAGVAQRRGEAARARRLLERAAALAPENATIHFELGRLLLEAEDYLAARTAFETCTRLAPQFPDGWAYLTGLLEATGNSRGALDVLARGLAHCPDSPGLHQMRAKRHQAAGRMEAAVADYRTAIRLRPTEADAQLELAVLLFKLNRVEEGVAELHAALEAEPEQPMALCLLGLHAINRGDASAAREWIARARDQPRVTREDVARLSRSFQQAFGRAP